MKPSTAALHTGQTLSCNCILYFSTHEHLVSVQRQLDTCLNSLTHHLSSNYSLCHDMSPGPLNSLIREVMGHCSCWPEVNERNAEPQLTGEEMKTCVPLVAWLAGKMDGRRAACRGRKWTHRRTCGCECVLWSKEVRAGPVPSLPSGLISLTCST